LFLPYFIRPYSNDLIVFDLIAMNHFVFYPIFWTYYFWPYCFWRYCFRPYCFWPYCFRSYCFRPYFLSFEKQTGDSGSGKAKLSIKFSEYIFNAKIVRENFNLIYYWIIIILFSFRSFVYPKKLFIFLPLQNRKIKYCLLAIQNLNGNMFLRFFFQKKICFWVIIFLLFLSLHFFQTDFLLFTHFRSFLCFVLL